MDLGGVSLFPPAVQIDIFTVLLNYIHIVFWFQADVTSLPPYCAWEKKYFPLLADFLYRIRSEDPVRLVPEVFFL